MLGDSDLPPLFAILSRSQKASAKVDAFLDPPPRSSSFVSLRAGRPSERPSFRSSGLIRD